MKLSLFCVILGLTMFIIVVNPVMGEYQWYPGTNKDTFNQGTFIEHSFLESKHIREVYVEILCLSNDIYISGRIQFFDENQMEVYSTPFSDKCTFRIPTDERHAVKKVRLTISEHHGGTNIYSKNWDITSVNLVAWQMSADDVLIVTPLPTPTPKPTPRPFSASINLYGEKTEVIIGEDVIFKLSAVNKITKPTMTVQVILIPPSGMSVTSSEFVTSGAGQFTSTFKLDAGAGRDIEIRVKTNQQGEFVMGGELIYYYGNDISNAEEQTLSLPIKVNPYVPPSVTSTTPVPGPGEGQFPVYGLLIIIIIFLLFIIIKRK